MREQEPSDSRYAFVCATPYQLYNSFSIMFSDKEKYIDSHASDVFVIDGFANASCTSERLREKDVFRHVVFVPSELDAYGLGEGKLQQQDRHCSLEKVMDFLRMQQDDCVMFPERGYDEIFFSLPTLTTTCLCDMSPNARLVLFDDGYGSYYGNILDVSGWMRRAPDEMNVWYPGMCYAEIGCEIGTMPNIADGDSNDGFREFVGDVFGYEELDADVSDERNGRKMVFLSQPFRETVLSNGALDAVQKVQLAGLQQGVTVVAKPHPRERAEDVTCVDGAVLDERGLSLEVLFLHGEIDDDTVLVGMFSTSQYLPVMMFGVHPRLLFLYRIMLRDEVEIAHLDALVEEVSAAYGRERDRICVANSVSEAIGFLER